MAPRSVGVAVVRGSATAADCADGADAAPGPGVSAAAGGFTAASAAPDASTTPRTLIGFMPCSKLGGSVHEAAKRSRVSGPPPRRPRAVSAPSPPR